LLGGCTGWSCDGRCNAGPNFTPSSPTEAPSEPYIPNDPVECLDGYEVDGKCIANALSEPVLVFDSSASQSCDIDKEADTITCPMSMDISLVEDGSPVDGLRFSLSTSITCPLGMVQDIGFMTATKIPGVCTSDTFVETATPGVIAGPGRKNRRELALSFFPLGDTCVWHTCPSDAISMAAVACDDAIIRDCHGFSCNGACNGRLDYVPTPPTETNPDPPMPLVFRDPLTVAEKEKNVSEDSITWVSDMIITAVTAAEDPQYYLSSQFQCTAPIDVNFTLGTEVEYFEYTRQPGNCACNVDVVDPGATTSRSLSSCMCHTCFSPNPNHDVVPVALVCESDVIPGCKSINCDGRCNVDLLFYPSPSPSEMPSLSPSTKPANDSPSSTGTSAPGSDDASMVTGKSCNFSHVAGAIFPAVAIVLLG
jgi:hypothetical protein